MFDLNSNFFRHFVFKLLLGQIKITAFVVFNDQTMLWGLWVGLDRVESDHLILFAETVYHSNSLLSSLSSTWTSKPPLAVKYRLDAASLDEPGGLKSLCSSLERLLAWEKKLYEEVKVMFLLLNI